MLNAALVTLNCYFCRAMEEWEFDFEWLQVRHRIKAQFDKPELPDLNAILFLIGINEVGSFGPFSKEQKQDLMHVAICTLLEKEGIYERVGVDDDGWPHHEQLRQMETIDRAEQERLLKLRVIEYFTKTTV